MMSYEYGMPAPASMYASAPSQSVGGARLHFFEASVGCHRSRTTRAARLSATHFCADLPTCFMAGFITCFIACFIACFTACFTTFVITYFTTCFTTNLIAHLTTNPSLPPTPSAPARAACMMNDDAARSADLSELLAHVHASWNNERGPLARQMHDSAGSSLTALTMHLQLLTQRLPLDPALQKRVAQMEQLLISMTQNNREMQSRLWNDKLEFLGAGVAIADLATQFGGSHALVVRCSLPDDELDCPRGHGVVLLQALEQGLSNIARHAQAREVDIIVDDNDDDDALMLPLKDDGIGLPALLPANLLVDITAQHPHARHGLRLIRERLRHLGGTLTLTNN
jgi:signal transduction histidine kinase